MKNCVASFLMASACLALTACGGGSSGGGNSGGGGGGTAVNRAPTFTTAAAISTAEQRTGEQPAVIVQLQANDADGDAVTFAIQSGPDAALFEFQGQNGALAFREAPSFETPADGNGDNVFEVTISASDGTATTNRTFNITLVNSTEGLVVERVAEGLPANGHVVSDSFNNLTYVISRDGLSVVRYNPADNSLTDGGPIFTFLGTLAGAEILDVVPTEIGFSSFSIIARRGTTLYYVYARRDDPSTSQILWSQDFPGTPEPVTASLWTIGADATLALGDGGLPAAAQDPTNPLGNIMELVIFGDGSGNLTSAEARTQSWGVRSPVLVTGRNRVILLDRGPRFNEFNTGAFNFPNTNFEWPIRDGLTDFGFTGTIQGNRIAPQRVLEIGQGGFGTWLSAFAGFDVDGWRNVAIIADDAGNILTYDYERDTAFELRNDDFAPNAGSITRIVSIDGNEPATWPLYLLDSDGELFRARVSR